jgi:hypothetical protein
MLNAVLCKLDGVELTAAICPERPQLAPLLCLIHTLELLDGGRSVYRHMKRLQLSTRSRKYQLPFDVAGVMGPHRSP